MLPFNLREILEEKQRAPNNEKTVQRARRPQAYVAKDEIATGTSKALWKKFRNYRHAMLVELTERTWMDAVKALEHLSLEGTFGAPPKAYISHGRWIADCPDTECAGAEVVDPDDPIFMCLSCGNIGNTRHNKIRVRSVIFPSAEDIKKIEAPLLQRPRIYRTWHPNETISDLWNQNLEHREELYLGSKIDIDEEG